MLLLHSGDNNIIKMKPYFVSSQTWYHFTLKLNKRTNELSLANNFQEIAKLKSNGSFSFDNIVLHFENNSTTGRFYTEQFRLIAANRSLSGINKNKNYSEYSDDSSRVLFQINFSEAELNSLLDQKMISYENIRLSESDAPIFPRAPKISVKLLNNIYVIEWEGGDFENADSYVLERALDSEDFVEVGRISAEKDENKVYSLVSEKFNKTDIVYFRVKQINNDGSILYSEIAKVGQGIVEDLIIGQNYPNPFNPTTRIEFELLQDSDVEVKVFNLTGKQVALLHKGFLNQGIYQFEFDAEGLSSGIYIYQISTPYSTQTRKMILAK